MAKKPKWVIDKERSGKSAAGESYWLFGIHAVRDALLNPARTKHRLIVTANALARLEGDLGGMAPEIADPRRFPAPLDAGSVHQGAALEVSPLVWGSLNAVCGPKPGESPVVVLLDRVTDPHNVGAILRSAEVFAAGAVIAPARHSAPETGALAKAASGALERQPYLRIRNLGDAIEELKAIGYAVLGFAGEAEAGLETELGKLPPGPLALVLGAEGPGLRQRTRQLCDRLVRIGPAGGFGSLNVSNAAAVGLYAATRASPQNRRVDTG